MAAALLAGGQFTRLYSNGARQGVVRSIDLHVQAIPHPIDVALDQARIASTDIAHAGDTITVEATLRPSHQPERNVRIAFKLPSRLASGNLRLLVSDAATLDRTLLQPRLSSSTPIFPPSLPKPAISMPPTAFMSAFSRLRLRPRSTVKPSPASRSPWPTPLSLSATLRTQD